MIPIGPSPPPDASCGSALTAVKAFVADGTVSTDVLELCE